MSDCKITTSGFELESGEKEEVQSLINSYCNKIKEKNLDISEIKLRLKKTKKGNNFLHEVQGDMLAKNKIFNSKVEDFNLFSALTDLFEKLITEYEHKVRK